MRTGRPRSTPGTGYRLRAVLARHCIPLRELQPAMRVSTPHGDAGMSLAAISRVLNHRSWPSNAKPETCRSAVIELLRSRALPEPEIKTAWDADLQVEAHAAPASQDALSSPDANPSAAEAVQHLDLPEIQMLSAAAREHFNLPAHPFVDDVRNPADVYLSREQRYVRESMYYTAKHQGFTAVIGESGSGKSTLRRDLLDRLQRDNERVVVIRPRGDMEAGDLRAAHLCEAIINAVSTERMLGSLEARSKQMVRLLSASAKAGYTHVLLIEEAQDCTKTLLKYCKRLWEMEDGFTRLLGILWIGQPELGDKLDERKNHDMREVIRRCEVATLRPLDANVGDYLALKFKRVGVDAADLLEAGCDEAIRRRLTRVNPRTKAAESQVYPVVVNNLVGAALNMAAELGLPKVTPELIGRL